jgi:hypothetical protein
MDLNLDSYSTDDLLSILQVNISDPTVDILREALLSKIDRIKNTPTESLPEAKENLTTFFTKAFFKIVNDKKLYRQEKESISVKTGLLPAMSENIIVQQNDSMVEKHTDGDPITTWHTSVKAGVINPLKRDVFKKILNLNTKFRDHYRTTKSNDFIFTLPYTLKKVVSLKLATAEFPRVVYSFSSALGSNYFRIASPSTGGAGPWILIEIPSGSYIPMTIVDVINAQLQLALGTVPPICPQLTYNSYDGTMTFSSSQTFDLDFDFIRSDVCPPKDPPTDVDTIQLTLGWLLGFRGKAIKTPDAKLTIHTKYICGKDAAKCPCYWACISPYGLPETPCKHIQTCKYYISEKAVDISNIYVEDTPECPAPRIYCATGESPYDQYGTKYFLLSVNDYRNNHNSVIISPFKYQSVADNDIIAKIPTDCCPGCCAQSVPRIYFGPVDLTKFHVKLFDDFGRLVEINNSDYSFSLEVELIYDL